MRVALRGAVAGAVAQQAAAVGARRHTIPALERLRETRQVAEADALRTLAGFAAQRVTATA